MNHLAHLYLSRTSEKLMVGNFIADAVKGKKFQEYETEISKGIVMHRAIDTFTDAHVLVSHSKSFFRARYGLYSPVIIDLVYDHFLAKNFGNYSNEPLNIFCDRCYKVFEKYFSVMPPRNQHLFPYMQKENWLLSYAQVEGIKKSLTAISRRIKNNPGIENATEELQLHYDELENDFEKYFPLLIKQVEPFVK
ncbi:MAG: ACP phosphodiesterase [Chitinophagales bacterium]|nr:ACP phosphodiesterase [Chitinophagales bacterium]